MYSIVRSVIGQREISAQEASIDAFGGPLIKFSRKIAYIQAREPEETQLRVKSKNRRDSSNPNDLFYDPAVMKYIKRMYKSFVICYDCCRSASKFHS